jgi:hypothetical protein
MDHTHLAGVVEGLGGLDAQMGRTVEELAAADRSLG